MQVLIVEDDLPLRHGIEAVLRDESYQVDSAENGEDGWYMAASGIYDLLILDIMLPEMDGITILKKLRESGIDTPALFLTAKDSQEDIVAGLDVGADDYLVKPFAVEILLARIRSLLRRAGKLAVEGQFVYGSITLLNKEFDASVGDSRLHLSGKEFELFQYLLQNREQILTRDQIFNRIWGFDSDTSGDIVELYIHYLRKKLTPFGIDHWIRTVRGVGYRLKKE